MSKVKYLTSIPKFQNIYKKSLPSLPSEIVRNIFEILFHEEPLNLFNFHISIYSKHYSKYEFSKLIIKCLKRDCQLNKKKYFLQNGTDKYKILFKNKKFISIINHVEESDYPEFLSCFCKIENGFLSHVKSFKIYNIDILKIIKKFDREKKINFIFVYSNIVFKGFFSFLKEIKSIDGFCPWDIEHLNIDEKTKSFIIERCKKLFILSIIKRNFQISKFLIDENIPIDKKNIIRKILTDKYIFENFEILNYLHSKNLCDCEPELYMDLIKYNYIESLQWLYIKGNNVWDFKKFCKKCIEYNRFEILEWCGKINKLCIPEEDNDEIIKILSNRYDGSKIFNLLYSKNLIKVNSIKNIISFIGLKLF